MTDGRRAVGRYGGRAVRAAVAGVLLTAVPPDRLTAQDTLPIGYGTLRRDDIAIRFATSQLELQVLPLEESVIRLLAPDTYESLRRLIETHRAALDSAARRAGATRAAPVMVTFFGVSPQARFEPEDVNILSRGRLFRPVAIVPLTPTWSTLQLDARQQAVALYLFAEGISFGETLTVSYQGLTNDSWARAIRALERERARVRARVRAAGPSR